MVRIPSLYPQALYAGQLAAEQELRPRDQPPLQLESYLDEDLPASPLSLGVHLHIDPSNPLASETLIDHLRYSAVFDRAAATVVSVAGPVQSSSLARRLVRLEAIERLQVIHRSAEYRPMDTFALAFSERLSAHDLVLQVHAGNFAESAYAYRPFKHHVASMVGTPDTVSDALDRFTVIPSLGLLFPEYHQALNNLLVWGSDFDAAYSLADAAGIEIGERKMAVFPAGEMFYARTEAISPLVTSYLDRAASDVPGQGAVLAKLMGTFCLAGGYTVSQFSTSAGAVRQNVYVREELEYPARLAVPRASAAVQNYRQAENSRLHRQPGTPRVVVFTSVCGWYEKHLPIPEYTNPDFDYVAITDGPVDDLGIWQVRPTDYWSPDPVRMARYVKTHPHKFFPDYDIAIWVDANVQIRSDLQPMIDRLFDPDEPAAFGFVIHPERTTVWEECQTLVHWDLDAASRMYQEMRFIEATGMPMDATLIESSLMISRLTDPTTKVAFAVWWQMIDSYSHRDQLGLNFALWTAGASWQQLLLRGDSSRNSPSLALCRHGRRCGLPVAEIHAALPGETKNPFSELVNASTAGVTAGEQSPRVKTVPVDVVICIHNALSEVKECLASVESALLPGDRIILVDDGSEPPTRDYLREFSAASDRVVLLQHDGEPRGYCASANVGMRAVQAERFLLLNSDTVLAGSALEKMRRVMDSNPAIGIVGPMSNAASTQSLPSVAGTAEQTAINELPQGWSVADMDAACDRWSLPGLYPSVPLVHGFCQLISRDVTEAIGYFDETSFPFGYGEENDFCFRASDAGFDLKIATNAYVYHVKSASYTDSERRQQLMQAGGENLALLHSSERITRAVKTMTGHPLLVRMRQQAAAAYEVAEPESGVDFVPLTYGYRDAPNEEPTGRPLAEILAEQVEMLTIQRDDARSRLERVTGSKWWRAGKPVRSVGRRFLG